MKLNSKEIPMCILYLSLTLVLCVLVFRGLGRTRRMSHACLCSPREVPPVANHLADDAAILGCGGSLNV